MLIKWIFKRESVVTTMIKDFGIISVVSLGMLNPFMCWLHDFVGADGNGGDNKREE